MNLTELQEKVFEILNEMIENDVGLIHILDYFADLPDELLTEVQQFIDEVKARRKGVRT